jgi:hypothetical protein
MTKRARRFILLAAPFTLIACGSPAPPDQPPSDGPRQNFVDPEGGNLFLEYTHLDTELQATLGLPAGVTTHLRVMAYFMNRHTPDLNPLPTPGACNNLVATRGWPLNVGTPREDLDVGALTITGKNTAGADVTIEVLKRPVGVDAIGRPHDIYYQVFGANAGDFLAPDSSYTVELGGAGIIPPTTFDGALFLPADFTVTMPMPEDNGPMQAGQPFNVRWNPATSANLPPAGEIVGGGVLGVTWLADRNGSPTHLCVVHHNAGEFTIPPATIAEHKAIAQARGTDPSKLILLRSAMVHRLATLPNGDPRNPRRIDMLAQVTWAQLMDVQ